MSGYSIFFPRYMCSEGYSSQFDCTCECVCVCLSVTVLAATYLVCKAKVRYHRVLNGVLQICNVGISLKTLHSKVMVLFAYHHRLPQSLKSSRWTEETAVSSL